MPTKKRGAEDHIHIYSGMDLHPAQAEVFFDNARFRVLNCGRKFGKSETLRAELLRVVSQNQIGAYMCPTFGMLSEMWRTIKNDLAPIIVDKSEQEHRLQTKNDAILRFFSLDNPDAARPFEYDFIAVDESAFVLNMLEVWERVLYPTIWKRKGKALFASSPAGFNGFWNLFDRGQPLYKGGPTKAKDWKSWKKPSWENPHLDKNEIDEMRRTMSVLAFSQEIEANFISDAGAVFRRVEDAQTASAQEWAIEKHTYVIGADLAKTNDFSVFCVIDVTLMSLVYIDAANHIDYKLQRERLIALCARFNPAGVIVEQNTNLAFMETLMDTGLPIIPFTTGGGGASGGTKALIIEKLAGAFDNSMLRILPDPELFSQLIAYQMERLPSGSFRYNGPRSGHDDYVMALALAYHGATYGVPSWSPEMIEMAPPSQTAFPLGLSIPDEIVAWPVLNWMLQ